MRSFSIQLLAALVVAAAASPLITSPFLSRKSDYVVHEARSNPPTAWRKHSKAHDSMVIPVRVGLAQQNLHLAEEFINSVSHPASPEFGKHWSPKKVADTFAPHPDSVQAVRKWLRTSGISTSRISKSPSHNWLMFNATIAEMEDLLDTKYHFYEHSQGAKHVACESYSIPSHLRSHIDIITPTVHFDRKVTAPKRKPMTPELTERMITKRQLQERDFKYSKIGSATDGSNPKHGHNIENALATLDDCDTMVTPACLQALYNVPSGKHAAKNNTLGVVEYTPQTFIQSDLNTFFSSLAPHASGTKPITHLIDGAVIDTSSESFNLNGESDLDLEYAMALVSPQKVTLYQVGDPVEGGSFNNFLDAIDASYCTFEGGDSNTTDAIYPDPYIGGFKGAENCGTVPATHVISTSYGSNEADLTPSYAIRQCHEYMKLGLLGISVLYSSGDFGVAGNNDECIDVATNSYNNGSDGMFNPSFPGTCPYVTSVGATQIKTGSSVRDAEMASETVIFSGGGFSNVFAMPSWQKRAVRNYYESFRPRYGSDRYNDSEAVRGYPDVSANGANYVTVTDGNFSLTYGTSASCPTFASIVTLLNEERIAVGKSPIGFLNPILYEYPSVLNDITQGGNQGCGTKGFEAVSGWDPVTGLGTPNWDAMKKLFLELP